jgi:two-component system sensor histidine kinase CiaH
MDRIGRKKRFAYITVVYWFLLAYLIAALAWWFIELWKQNEEMYAFKKELVHSGDPSHDLMIRTITGERDRNRAQYAGEGLIFLVVTLFGAVFVYRSARRQIRLNTQQQNFMMAVTHELKTPIAITKLNLETLGRHRLDEEKQQKIISSTLQETNRLNDLCNNILLSSQLDAGGFTINKELLDVAALTEETVRDFRQRFPHRTIVSTVNRDPRIMADPLLLRLALNNLIENAIKYSPANKPIEVSLDLDDSMVKISVKDQGAGIPDAEKKKIFDRFYRIGAEETRQTKGTGLGLYLTRKIIGDHGGQMEVKDNIPCGSNFVIGIPKTRS